MNWDNNDLLIKTWRRRMYMFALMSVLFFGSLKSQPAPDPQIRIDRLYHAPADQINITRLRWLPDSHEFWVLEEGSIVVYNIEQINQPGKIVLSASALNKAGLDGAVEQVVWGNNRQQALVYTNSKRVWRGNTRGDYWYFNLQTGEGRKLGKSLLPSSLMFAKLSPDGSKAAYVSKHNIYVEDLASGTIIKLTQDGTERVINGTFDWVYEEEMSCRDGFRWGPDSKRIVFWRVDARLIKNHLMINNTDSLYPFTIPVEYPKAGEKPSAVTIGVVQIKNKKTTWLKIPGEADNNYLPRLEWVAAEEILVAQLNRRQQEVRLFMCSPTSGKSNQIYQESDPAWLTVDKPFVWDDLPWKWINNKQDFLWSSEQDGWQHIYKISRDGKQKTLLTPGAYDADLAAVDHQSGRIYFSANPYDSRDDYLYSVSLQGGDTVRVTPQKFDGTNTYRFSTDARFATHLHGNITTQMNARVVALPGHTKVYPSGEDEFKVPDLGFKLEKINVVTADGVPMEGIMAKPHNFDPAKKYPVYFYVYGEPASTTANNLPGFDDYIAQLIPQGYIGLTFDNRGTPARKGREWRKSIYRKMGVINSRDQAMAAKEVLKWPFIDPERVAVHGWSGGGAMTLNLLFRYPEIFKTGIAVAAVTDQHFYDNIYTERFMGLPQDNKADYILASPVTHAKNLQGNLLYIHGTGDDNVHYKNAEVLINELVKHNKLFHLMIYPNRTHGIAEGEGTGEHLNNTFLQFLWDYCPPGAK